MESMSDDNFETKIVRAADVDDFIKDFPATEMGEKVLVAAVRGFLHSDSVKDFREDEISLRRCPICKQFPEISYYIDKERGFPSVTVSLRCKCYVGVRGNAVFERPYPSEKQKDATIHRAEQCAVQAWGRLISERLEENNE